MPSDRAADQLRADPGFLTQVLGVIAAGQPAYRDVDTGLDMSRSR